MVESNNGFDASITDEQIREIVRDDELSLDDDVYRYLPIERYFQMIEDGYNALVHISYWQDPYEAFVFRGGIRLWADDHREMENVVYDKFRYVYGQSWTLQKNESDVLWRAMGDRGTLVRIKTSIRKLARSLLHGEKGNCTKSHLRIAKIRYVDREKIDGKLMEDSLRYALSGDRESLMKFFFVKRSEFSLEKEVRIIAIPDDGEINREKCTNGGLLKFSINPSELIEEVLVDPCASQRDFEKVKCRTRFVSTQIRVDKSDLFDWPEPRDIMRDNPVDAITVVPCDEAVRSYLRNEEHKHEGNINSIMMRILRILNAVHYVSDVAPTYEQLLGIFWRIQDFISGVGSVYDCRSAIRAYMRALYGHDDRGQCCSEEN